MESIGNFFFGPAYRPTKWDESRRFTVVPEEEKDRDGNFTDDDYNGTCERCDCTMPIDMMQTYNRGAYTAYYCEECLDELDITSEEDATTHCII